MTDLTVFGGASGPLAAADSNNLRLAFRGMSSQSLITASTPKGLELMEPRDELGIFMQVADHLPTGGSTVSNASSHDLVIFGNNEVMDFDCTKYNQKPTRSRLETERTRLTFEEMRQRAPKLFQHKTANPLLAFLLVEESYARNLADCFRQMVHHEEASFSETMSLGPLSLLKFRKCPERYMELAGEITSAFLHLQQAMNLLNQRLAQEYNANIIQLKWEIFTNASTIKDFENARPMFDALLRFKEIFDGTIHGTDHWVEIGEYATEMGHLIEEWNEMIRGDNGEDQEDEKKEMMGEDINLELIRAEENQEPREANWHEKETETYIEENKGTDDTSSRITEQHLRICAIVFSVNAACTAGSDFARLCGFFLRQLEETKRSYEEFVARFWAEDTKDGIFLYEICLLDDHMRQVKIGSEWDGLDK